MSVPYWNQQYRIEHQHKHAAVFHSRQEDLHRQTPPKGLAGLLPVENDDGQGGNTEHRDLGIRQRFTDGKVLRGTGHDAVQRADHRQKHGVQIEALDESHKYEKTCCHGKGLGHQDHIVGTQADDLADEIGKAGAAGGITLEGNEGGCEIGETVIVQCIVDHGHPMAEGVIVQGILLCVHQAEQRTQNPKTRQLQPVRFGRSGKGPGSAAEQTVQTAREQRQSGVGQQIQNAGNEPNAADGRKRYHRGKGHRQSCFAKHKKISEEAE